MAEIIAFLKENALNTAVLAIVSAIAAYSAVRILLWILPYIALLLLYMTYALSYLVVFIIQLISIVCIKLFRINNWTTLFDVDMEIVKRKIKAIAKYRPVWVMHYGVGKIRKIMVLSILIFIAIGVISPTSYYDKLKVNVAIEYDITGKLIGQFSDEKSEHKTELTTVAAPSIIRYVVLQEEYPRGNVRASGTLNAREVGVVERGNRYLFLGEVDHDGEREWYKIAVDDSLEGWVSSAIVEVIELEED